MVLNELAQWSVLIILAIFLFGLTRQLGYLLRPPEAQRGADWGPDVGAKLPEKLLTSSEQMEIGSLMTSANKRAAALLLVHERCGPCDAWLDFLEESDGVDVPLVMISSKPSAEYTARLSRSADLIISDNGLSDRLQATSLTATPFLILVDKRFRIRHKQLGGNLQAGLDSWTPTSGRAVEVSGNGANELRVEAVTGERSES
jgi:hypothetical protein